MTQGRCASLSARPRAPHAPGRKDLAVRNLNFPGPYEPPNCCTSYGGRLLLSHPPTSRGTHRLRDQVVNRQLREVSARLAEPFCETSHTSIIVDHESSTLRFTQETKFERVCFRVPAH